MLSGFSVSLSSTLMASGLLALASATAAAEDSGRDCDCACDRYAEQVLIHASSEADHGGKLVRCGGACAIAWTDCEIRSACGAAPKGFSNKGVSSTGDKALTKMIGGCPGIEDIRAEPVERSDANNS